MLEAHLFEQDCKNGIWTLIWNYNRHFNYDNGNEHGSKIETVILKNKIK